MIQESLTLVNAVLFGALIGQAITAAAVWHARRRHRPIGHLAGYEHRSETLVGETGPEEVRAKG